MPELGMYISPPRQFVLWALAAVLGLLGLWWVIRWENQRERQLLSSFLMGDPRVGAHLFSSKGCGNCHPLFGQGGGAAPDLGMVLRGHASMNDLVSEMWNHAPRMWASLRERKVEYVDIRSQEMADIFAFLYTVRYLDQPGDLGRGEHLFRQKGCLECHGVRGSGGKAGPDIATPSFADTPISWVRALWNHAARPEAGKSPSSQAKLEGDDVADLLAFVRDVGTGPREERKLFPADLAHGEQVFKRQGCADCHTRWVAGRPAASWPRSVPQLAGVMWNHATELQLWKKTNSRLALGLEGKEAADLIAYLYTLRSLDPPGDGARGREVYKGKNCSVCHGPDAAGTAQAPNLRKLRGTFTPIFLAETLWRHGPKIYEQMAKRGMTWPEMETHEMNDLLAFLNSD